MGGVAVGCETVAASPLDLATGNLPILATLATLLPCCHLQSRLATLESCQESTLTPISQSCPISLSDMRQDEFFQICKSNFGDSH